MSRPLHFSRNMDSSMQEKPRGFSIWFILVVALFITSLITANLVAVKLIDIAGLIMPAGVVIFPISYIVGDVLTEVYGYQQARRVIWLGFLCNLLVVMTIMLLERLPAPGFWDGQDAYERILGFTPRLLLASFLAYLVGEFANSAVMAQMKVATEGRFLWMRTIGSTIVGQGLDSSVFIVVAFYGAMPTGVLVNTVLIQWVVKSVYEALATPVTYVVIRNLKSREKTDVYDTDTSFSPFTLRG
jgi:queuosine precursor transporter